MQPDCAPEETLLDRFCARTDPRFAPETMIVVAHADDEVIGAGGRFPWLARITVVHVTDSVPLNPADARAAGFATRGEYARARRAELEKALSLAGIPRERCAELGIRDQEASFYLAEIAASLAGLIERKRPEVVLTHAYDGGHPDHDAAAFAVAAAVALVGRRTPARRPAALEFAGYSGPGGLFRAFEFISREGFRENAVALTVSESRLKKKMIGCFATQAHMLGRFPVEMERFRRAPPYRFSEPPHAGKLFYEHFDWGVTGKKWRELARRALTDLDLGGL